LLEILMIDHIGFPVSDYQRSKALFTRWPVSAPGVTSSNVADKEHGGVCAVTD
jgi:catechol 2,3-dioxygenase-like lactoylglutathione lyase family enzyme